MLEHVFSSDSLFSLLTLTAMELVLGIDNIVFLSILIAHLPKEQKQKARYIGLSLAMIMRIFLLLTIQFMMRLDNTLFYVMNKGLSGKDLILLAGGIFLIFKSSHEIFLKTETHDQGAPQINKHASFAFVIAQIVMIDLVFSIDSVVTAVGMAQALSIMIVATLLAMLLMLIFSGSISHFVNQHPSMKVLALSFLLLIGVMLVADAMGQHIAKGYIYTAMCFSFCVELINLRKKIHTRSR